MNMSKFERTINDYNTECPYCGYEHDFENDSFNEEQSVIECDSCGKKFYGYQCVMIDHRSEPDCELNDESHDYQMPKLGNGESHRFCSVCGKCEPIS
jgi:hypothetical protein